MSKNMIQFKDFVPEIKKRLFLSNDIEDLSVALERMNDWLRKNEQYQIINIETVVLPNMHSRNEEGSIDPELSFAEYNPVWYQFFRVWYRV